MRDDAPVAVVRKTATGRNECYSRADSSGPSLQVGFEEPLSYSPSLRKQWRDQYASQDVIPALIDVTVPPDLVETQQLLIDNRVISSSADQVVAISLCLFFQSLYFFSYFSSFLF